MTWKSWYLYIWVNSVYHVVSRPIRSASTRERETGDGDGPGVDADRTNERTNERTNDRRNPRARIASWDGTDRGELCVPERTRWRARGTRTSDSDGDAGNEMTRGNGGDKGRPPTAAAAAAAAGDADERRATVSAASGSRTPGDVFNMEQLKAAVDRHHKHFSSEVERAWNASNFSFSFGSAPRSSSPGVTEELARGGDGEADAARRAGRKKKLSISAITELARRASQDSLAKLDDARFMERLRRRPRMSGADDVDKEDDERGSESRRSTQDLQALIAKSMPRAPSIPKWGEEWDVFKAISANQSQEEAKQKRQQSERWSGRQINRRRAQSETIDRAGMSVETAAPKPPTTPKASPGRRPVSPGPPRMTKSASLDDVRDTAPSTSEPPPPRNDSIVVEGSDNVNVFDNFKKEITARLPRPPSLPKMNELQNELQNAVRRLAGKSDEVMISSPHDASLSSPGVMLKRSESKELTSAEALEARETMARAANGKDMPRSIREPGRSVAIVTTATLPWMTGTAVNPLLRAAYLARRGIHDVTLVIPFLAPKEQAIVHPNMIFNTPEEQGEYVKKWVEERCGFKPEMKLSFYPGRYATDKYSIIPVGDLTSYIPGDRDADIAVLEEPEHLNWYHAGERWTDKFKHVVGIVHTNYLDYVRLEENGPIKEKALRFVNNVVSSVHCHKVIKLSDAVQEFPKSTTMNVHGVSPIFLDVGSKKAIEASKKQSENVEMVNGPLASIGRTSPKPKLASKASKPVFSKGAYFLGKVVWGKGYKELLDRVSEHNASDTGRDHPLELDVFGNGDDFDDVKSSSEQRNLPLHFRGRKDHAAKDIHDYKVFVNPSLSDVVATTTAEALAMGKFVVCAKHPSNEFFSSFPNCLVYDNPREFSECVHKALTTDPEPLSANDSYRLSWEAATDRFLDAAELTPKETNLSFGDRAKDKFAHAMHTALTSAEPIRRATGAGANTLNAPEKLDGTWEPEAWDSSARDSRKK